MAAERESSAPKLASEGKGDWRRFAFPATLALVCGALYLWRLGVTPLEDFDEAYYAAGAREMLARGNLGTPYFNGQPFLLKPILVYWIIAGAFRLLGPTEFVARAGSAFLGTLIVLMTYWFGARTLGRRAGFLAGLALGLCYMWVDIGRDASIDIPLTAALTPAVFLLFLATQAPRDRKRRLYLGVYPLLGVALLAKGPVPVGVVAVGVLAYLAAARRLWATLRQGQVLLGLALTLAVAGPWYWYELRHQPAFFATFFVGEHFGHIQGELARRTPAWGNLWYLLVYFYPWAAFLPAAVLHAFRQEDRGHVLRLAAWWTLAVAALFTIPKSKLAHYLAPGFPAAALLVGAWLDAWLKGQRVSRAGTVVGLGLVAVWGLACAAAAGLLAVMPQWAEERLSHQFGDWRPGWSAVAVLGALAVGSLAAAAAGAVGKRGAAVVALCGAMAVAAVAHVGWFAPHRAEIQAQPRRELARVLARALPADERLGVYYAKRNATVFYFGRPIVDLGERGEEFPGVVRFLSSPRPSAVLTHRRFAERLEALIPGTRVIAERGDYVAVANEPVEGSW